MSCWSLTLSTAPVSLDRVSVRRSTRSASSGAAAFWSIAPRWSLGRRPGAPRAGGGPGRKPLVEGAHLPARRPGSSPPRGDAPRRRPPRAHSEIGRPTTTPTAWYSLTDPPGPGDRRPITRLVSMVTAVATAWALSVTATPILTIPRSTPSTRPEGLTVERDLGIVRAPRPAGWRPAAGHGLSGSLPPPPPPTVRAAGRSARRGSGPPLPVGPPGPRVPSGQPPSTTVWSSPS